MHPRRSARALGALMTFTLLSATAAVTSTTGAQAAPPLNPVPRCSTTCISIGDVSVLEGDSGTRVVSVPVTLSKAPTSAVTVVYTIVAGTATAGSSAANGDFNNKNGALTTLSFAAGATVMKPINVTVYADTAAEAAETFHIALSDPTNAFLQRAQATGTIIDDDASATTQIGVGDAVVVEGNSGNGRKVTFPVTLSNAATSPITLNYVLTDGSAVRGAVANTGDYSGSISGTVKFTVSAGTGKTATLKKLAIAITAETGVELDESFTVTISASSLPPNTAITRATGTATIIDDDPATASTPVPNSMAALGDSITKAFSGCPTIIGDCPAAAWATGTTSGSHYQRILAINPSINGNAFNNAVSGAVMSGLNGQALNAVSQGAQYVTILMGANDACKPNEASMTSVATFQSQFQTAMNTIHNGLPNARILVMSIPDLHRLWEVGSASATARTVWANFGICQAMLANPTSTAQVDVDRRLRVRQRVVDYNAALTTVCNATANCLTDAGALFNTQFLLNDLATFDFFHPSGAAQQRLAAASYSVYNW